MSELSREEDLIAATILANQFYHDSGLTVYLDARASARKAMEHYGIRTALAGGGGGEKTTCVGTCDFDYLHAELGRRHARIMELEACTKGEAVGLANHLAVVGELESRLAAAEKDKAEAARIAFENGRASAVVLASDGRSGDAATWRDRCLDAEKRAEEAEASAQAHIGHYERTVGERNDAVRKIDALKAELAEAKKRITTAHDSVAVFIAERDAALSRVEELELKLAAIRDAAGAQP